MTRRQRRRHRPGTATAAADGRKLPRARGGGSGRAAAGAMRFASTIGAAISNRRVLGRAEAGPLLAAGVALLVASGVALLWPRLVVVPLAVMGLWIGISLVARYWAMRRP